MNSEDSVIFTVFPCRKFVQTNAASRILRDRLVSCTDGSDLCVHPSVLHTRAASCMVDGHNVVRSQNVRKLSCFGSALCLDLNGWRGWKYVASTWEEDLDD